MGKVFYRVAAAMLTICCASAASAEWYEAKSNHFIIYSEQAPKDLRDYAEKLERFDQAVRAARSMDDPTLTDATRLTVYVLPGQRDIASLAGPGVAGFYIPSANGSVAYVSTEKSEGRGDLAPQTVFMHEYLHHLMLMGRPAPYPMWMSEGYAEFFATARFEPDGSVTFGIAPDHRGRALRLLQSEPLSRMLDGAQRHMTGEEYYANYTRGWLLSHYLAFEPSRRGQVSRYLQGIAAGKDGIKAAEEAFGDIGQLDKELKAYLGRDVLPVQTVPAAKITTGPVAIRTLRPGEEDSLKVWIKLNAGADSKDARYLIGAANGAVSRNPGSAAALVALAAAQTKAKRYEEAIQSADKAIAIDPNSLQALTYKAQSMVGLGKQSPQGTDWAAVRRTIAAANKIDPDAPEPLVLFYESYRAANEKPTPNAISGLIYALSLAPYDADLRRTVVRELLAENRIAEARMAYGPVAYRPHAGKTHDRALDIMDKIAAGQAAAAVAMLDEDERKREKEE